jgi:hypothetical protein
MNRATAVFVYGFATLACLSPLRAAESANLVRNPGFEMDANGDGVPDEWERRTPATATWVTTDEAGKAHCVDLRKQDEKAE